MAFSRHNIEKHRLIELVRDNPILWDCRLPHYKRSDKRKAVKWNELGRVFRVNGERVQRTFTSLREIFRRELNHEKLLGTRFKSKWEYYEAMAFLKEVIRERKSRERAKSVSLPQPNSSSGIDEYQYFAPNDPNNPNNQQQQQQQQQPEQQAPQTAQQQSPQQSQQQQQQQPLIQLHPDVILNVNATQLQQQLQQLTTNVLQTQLQQQQQEQQKSLLQQHLSPNQPDLLSSIDSGSSSPSIYIKDEPDSQDETISVSTTNNEKASRSIKSPAAASAPIPITTAATTSNCQQVTTTATQAHMLSSSNNNNNNNNNNLVTTNNNHNNYKTTSSQRNINYNGNQSHGSKLAKQLQRNGFVVAPAAASAVSGNFDADCDIDDIDLDADDLDDDIDDADDIDDIVAPATTADGRLSAATTVTLRRRRESPREILYTKFGDFLAARLNTLNETVANELMNKILMLIAEK